MSNTRKPASVWETINLKRQARLKELKKARFKRKAKLFLTVILPVFTVILFVKVIQAFVRIKVRELFAKPEKKPASGQNKAAPEKACMTPVEKEIITPEPVSIKGADGENS